MTLQAAMQRRARQMRDGRLQGVQAVVQRQQRVPPEGDDDRLLFDRQDRRPGILRSGSQIFNQGPSLPLGDGLGVDPMTLRQAPQALLTMLYRSTDRRCRCGAPVVYLPHSASFQPSENSAPSKSGTKHLGPVRGWANCA